jgi:hypothetical protein
LNRYIPTGICEELIPEQKLKELIFKFPASCEADAFLAVIIRKNQP